MSVITNKVIRSMIKTISVECAMSMLMENYGYTQQAAKECIESLNVEME